MLQSFVIFAQNAPQKQTMTPDELLTKGVSRWAEVAEGSPVCRYRKKNNQHELDNPAIAPAWRTSDLIATESISKWSLNLDILLDNFTPFWKIL